MLQTRKSEGLSKRFLWLSVGFVGVSVLFAHEYSIRALTPRELGVALLALFVLTFFVLGSFLSKGSTNERLNGSQHKRALVVRRAQIAIVVLVVLLINALLQIGKRPLVPLLVGAGIGLCTIAILVRTVKRLQEQAPPK